MSALTWRREGRGGREGEGGKGRERRGGRGRREGEGMGVGDGERGKMRGERGRWESGGG